MPATRRPIDASYHHTQFGKSLPTGGSVRVRLPDVIETSGTHCTDQDPSRRLLRGTCTLIFEGQSFVADDADDRQYWLAIDDKMRGQLIDRLQPLGWPFETESFHAEFWGRLTWLGQGCGHLGMFGGDVTIDELVSVQFAKAKHVGPKFHSIAERLRSLRTRSSS